MTVMPSPRTFSSVSAIIAWKFSYEIFSYSAAASVRIVFASSDRLSQRSGFITIARSVEKKPGSMRYLRNLSQERSWIATTGQPAPSKVPRSSPV